MGRTCVDTAKRAAAAARSCSTVSRVRSAISLSVRKTGRGFTYSHVRGYHPLLAVAAGTGEVLHSRLRRGQAQTVWGAASFLAETVSRLREAGASGELTLRADAGFQR